MKKSNKLESTETHYNLALKEIGALDKKKEFSVLEVGAGNKTIKNFLSPNFTYHTLDNAEEFWKEKYTFSHNLDGGKFPIEDNIYDIIICNETLEHVMYPEKVIKEMMRVAKDDAMFFFSMPNEYNFIMRFYYLIGKKTKVDEPFKVVEKNLHIHKPRTKDIIELFSKHLKINKVDYIWKSRMSEKSSFVAGIDKVINSLAQISPSLFSRTVVVKATRKKTNPSS